MKTSLEAGAAATHHKQESNNKILSGNSAKTLSNPNPNSPITNNFLNPYNKIVWKIRLSLLEEFLRVILKIATLLFTQELLI